MREIENKITTACSALTNNDYLQITGWYKKLSLTDKLLIPIKDLCINLRECHPIFKNIQLNTLEILQAQDLINKDLYNLKIIDFYYPSKLDTRARIQYQVSKLVLNENKLLNASFYGKIGSMLPSKKWRDDNFGFNFTSVNKYSNELKPLMDKMIVMGLIDINASIRINNFRIRALYWFRNLSTAAKIEHIKENKGIYFQSVLSRFDFQDYSSLYFKPVIEEIDNNLNELGIINGLLPEIFSPRKVKIQKSKAEWDELSDIPIISQADLVEPTPKKPYIQLKHLFAQHMLTKVSHSYKQDVRSVFKHVTILIKADFGNQPIRLTDWLDEFTLNRFHKYLEEQMIEGNLNNRFANVLQTTFKNILNRAKALNIPNFKRFYLSSAFSYNDRVTNKYKPYSESERTDINNAITSEIEHVKSLMSEYKKSGDGRPVFDNAGIRINKPLAKYTLGDARWIFENNLNCEATLNSIDFNESKYTRLLYRIIQSHNKYHHDVYESWGVLSRVTINHLIPFLLRFLQITGMNIESIATLEIDDFIQKHPASGKPCIRYWKERSNGEKEYHLDIFKANLQWLTNKQGQEVKNIFDTIVKLTSSIRIHASNDLKNKLWLFSKKNGKLMSLPNQAMHKGFSTFSKKYKLKNEDNVDTRLISTRFRPTFVSELIDKGVSIREIQLLLGHKNLYTTMRYLDIQDFSNISREKIKEKLIQIHINAHTSNYKNNLAVPKAKNKNKKNVEVMLSTPFATCKNIFNPPESVKKLTSYTPGKPCSTYNMCLSCPNVIITKSDLPKLFAMKRDYLVKIQNTRILDTPFGEVISTNLELINEITDKGKSNFDIDELYEAEILSLYVETTEIY
ncbi:MAG: tyrosine-type recombinase/integrase [Colwellia sp.]